MYLRMFIGCMVLLFMSIFMLSLSANAAEPVEEELVSLTQETADQLAGSIIEWKRRVDHSVWWECGVRYTLDEAKEAAQEWADAIVTAHNNTTYTLRFGKNKDKLRRVDLNEVIGIIINESRFDRCALGPSPRNFAYAEGILQRKKNTFSHPMEDLERLVKHPKMRGKKLDLGPGQILKRIPHKGDAWDTFKDYLTLTPGIQKLFDELAHRGFFYNRTKPSSTWPGLGNHKAYTVRVLMNAQSLFSPPKHKR